MGKKKQANYKINVPVKKTHSFDVEALSREEALEVAQSQALEDNIKNINWENAYVEEMSIVEFFIMVDSEKIEQTYVLAYSEEDAIETAHDLRKYDHDDDGYDEEFYDWKNAMAQKLSV